MDKNKKRQMIVQHRDQYEQTIVECEIQLESLTAQPHVDEDERTELTKQLTDKKENAEAARDRMNALLKGLSAKSAPSKA